LTRVTVLSRHGYYLETKHRTAGTRVTVKIINKDQIFEATATVLYSRPTIGMAVAFREVKPLFRSMLRDWLQQSLNQQNQKPSLVNLKESEKAARLVGIVDDDKAVSKAINNLLRAAGYQTQVFESAEAMLNGDHKQEIGCLVLGGQMSGMSGLELQRRLTRMKVSIPVVFVTAQTDTLGEQARAQGAVAVLAKPFTGDSLLDAIRLALARKA
jgi:CheY-like chemotaxis protein